MGITDLKTTESAVVIPNVTFFATAQSAWNQVSLFLGGNGRFCFSRNETTNCLLASLQILQDETLGKPLSNIQFELAIEALEKFVTANKGINDNYILSQAKIVLATLYKLSKTSTSQEAKMCDLLNFINDDEELKKQRSLIDKYAANKDYQALKNILNEIIDYQEIIKYGRLETYVERKTPELNQKNIFTSEEILKSEAAKENPIAKLVFGAKLWSQGKLKNAYEYFEDARNSAERIDPLLGRKFETLIGRAKQNSKEEYNQFKQNFVPSLDELQNNKTSGCYIPHRP